MEPQHNLPTRTDASREDEAIYGQKRFEWTFPEYEKHKRGPIWYFMVMFIAGSFALYAIWDRNFLFLIMIVLFVFILFVQHRREPIDVRIAFFDRGVKVGRDFYLYREIDRFAVVYDPPAVKRLYLYPRETVLRDELSIPLMDQNPLDIRSFLVDYLVEDLDKEQESTHEALSRIFKV